MLFEVSVFATLLDIVVKLRGWDVAQAVDYSAVKVWNLLHGRSNLHDEWICSLGYVPFHPVVHNWPIKGGGM